MKVLVAYSGGKDSQASLIWATKKYGADKIQAVFCDTGWEHPVTYKHIKETTQQMGVELVTLKSQKYDGMIGLATKKKRFPSSQARFCTEELKSKPMIDYILDEVNDDLIIIQGIRGDESPARSLMRKQCRLFKYYFQHYKIDKKGRKRYHNYRKADVTAFCEKHMDDVLRPVFKWAGKQVIDYIITNGQRPNPLYYEGFKRVGCFPCIMASHPELRQIIDRYPERIDLLIEIEGKVGSTFFAPDTIPEWYLKDIDSKGNKIAPMGVIRDYINDKNATLDMFEPEGLSCMSFYGLCE